MSKLSVHAVHVWVTCSLLASDSFITCILENALACMCFSTRLCTCLCAFKCLSVTCEWLARALKLLMSRTVLCMQGNSCCPLYFAVLQFHSPLDGFLNETLNLEYDIHDPGTSHENSVMVVDIATVVQKCWWTHAPPCLCGQPCEVTNVAHVQWLLYVLAKVLHWVPYGNIAQGRGQKASIARGVAECYISLETTPTCSSDWV